MRQLYDVIYDETGYRPASDDDRLYGFEEGALGLDSLDSVELGMAIEEEFCIMITDEEWEAVRTVGDIRKLLDGTP